VRMFGAVVVGLVQELAHQRHQFGLGELALGRPRRFALTPIVVTGRGHVGRFTCCGHREPGSLLVVDTHEARVHVDVSFTRQAEIV